jgi:3-dehydroquinate synthetase
MNGPAGHGHSPAPVRVSLGARSYDVRIGRGILADLPEALAECLGRPPRAACAVIDRNAETHARPVLRALADAGVALAEVTIDATEPDKSLETLRRILTEMGRARLERNDPVIAVGGGIVGDVAGLAASTYRRGVPVLQCPTTLLAMVDASVGGKTGVNLQVDGQLQKNMVGAFHQPALVLADTATLDTLPERHFRAGLAECIKHGLIDGAVRDGSHLDWIERTLLRILARDPEALAELIERSVRCKAAVVAGDEHERLDAGGRAMLNLGHTFAHAIETIETLTPTGRAEDAPLLHGEAVALGLIAAAEAGVALRRSPPGLPGRVGRVLGACALPTRIAALPDDGVLLARMGADKKSSGGRLRIVVPLDGHRAEVVDDPPSEAIARGWAGIRLGETTHG